MKKKTPDEEMDEFEEWWDKKKKQRCNRMKFWECYVERTGGGQHRKHYSLEEAQTEAERLARKEQSKIVYLFECVGKCKVEEMPIKWEIPR